MEHYLIIDVPKKGVKDKSLGSAMHLSVLLTSFPSPFAEAVRQAMELGFAHVDVVAEVARCQDDLEVLADSGLLVACAAVGRGLPEGWEVDAAGAEIRRQVLDRLKRQIEDAARLGATHAYLVPGNDATADGLAKFGELCSILADFAGDRMIRCCVEHVPGRALPTAAAALAWLKKLGHPNLRLLLDVGHCLISCEDPSEIIVAAGDSLGYVHFDDNDGVQDCHWPLLTGCLTHALLERLFSAFGQVGYDSPVALELQAQNPDVVTALDHNKRLLERLIHRA
jgi:sugar phosphate isomerase/epimerase